MLAHTAIFVQPNNNAVINTFPGTDWSRLGRDPKRDYIIDHVMPWYAGFYISWRRAEAAGHLDCLFVHDEELIADKPGTLHKIADFLGMEKPSKIASAPSPPPKGPRAGPASTKASRDAPPLRSATSSRCV